jgi:cell division protein FtsL
MARAAAASVAAPARPAPARRPAPVRRGAPVRRRPAPAAAPSIAARAGALARTRAEAAFDGLLHGPGLIGLVFVLLAGVVFSNVALLQSSRQITSDAARVSALKRDNASLRRDVAELGSIDRIQQVAAERGLILPAPGDIRYLRSNPRTDTVNAAKRIDDGLVAPAPTPTYTAAAPTYTPPVDPAAVAPTTTLTPTYGQAPTYSDGTAIAGTPDAVTDAAAGLP